MKEIARIAEAIKKFNKFLITSHINPEGDSLGSQLAMANLLKALNKKFVVIDNDPVPSRYAFLPCAEIIKNKIGKNDLSFDAAIVLDCPNLKRTGSVKEIVKGIDFIINIDHHVSNERFGNLNWVEKNASSVGEMIHSLYKKMKCEMNAETALYLYISILTDTGSFNYGNTSSVTHEIVSELLGFGIKPYGISKSIYENKTLGELKLLGRVLSDLKVTEDGKIAYMAAPKKLFDETETGPSACENFVNFARSVRGVEVAVFFREDMKKKNSIHVSFRSGGSVDVNRIASHFGGGGHKTASGCSVRESFEEVKRDILKEVKDAIRRNGSC